MDFATLDSLKTVIVSLIQSKPYGDGVEIEKKECVGHIQKRMGCALRNLVTVHTGEKTHRWKDDRWPGKAYLSAYRQIPKALWKSDSQ